MCVCINLKATNADDGHILYLQKKVRRLVTTEIAYKKQQKKKKPHLVE